MTTLDATLSLGYSISSDSNLTPAPQIVLRQFTHDDYRARAYLSVEKLQRPNSAGNAQRQMLVFPKVKEAAEVLIEWPLHENASHKFLDQYEHSSPQVCGAFAPILNKFLSKSNSENVCIIGFGVHGAGTTWALGMVPTSPGILKCVYKGIVSQNSKKVLSVEVRTFHTGDGISVTWPMRLIETEQDLEELRQSIWRVRSTKRYNWHIVLTLYWGEAKFTIVNMCSDELLRPVFGSLGDCSALSGSKINDDLSKRLDGCEIAILASISSLEKKRDECLKVIELLRVASNSLSANFLNSGDHSHDLTELSLPESVPAEAEVGAEAAVEAGIEAVLVEADFQAELVSEVVSAEVEVEAEAVSAQVEVEVETVPAEVEVEAEAVSAEVEVEVETVPAEVEVEAEAVCAEVEVEVEAVSAEVEVEVEAVPAEAEVEADAVLAEVENETGADIQLEDDAAVKVVPEEKTRYYNPPSMPTSLNTYLIFLVIPIAVFLAALYSPDLWHMFKIKNHSHDLSYLIGTATQEPPIILSNRTSIMLISVCDLQDYRIVDSFAYVLRQAAKFFGHVARDCAAYLLALVNPQKINPI